MGPFLNYAKNRELRKELFLAYGGLCNNDEFNNNDIVKEIVELKHKRDKLLGFDTFADYVLDDRMAQNVTNVYDLLDNLYNNCYNKAKKEFSASGIEVSNVKLNLLKMMKAKNKSILTLT